MTREIITPMPLCLSVHHSLVNYTRTTSIHSLSLQFTLQKSASLAHIVAHVQLSHIHSTTSWARDRLCSYAFKFLRSTHHIRMGRFPFHSYRRQTMEQVLPRCCHSTVCPCGLAVIESQDSFRLWSGIFGLIRLAACPSQRVVILLSACSTSFNSVPQNLGQCP